MTFNIKITDVHKTFRLFVCFLFVSFFNDVFSETIYQWTDQWGQIRYSKTQVPGSMISELTELPKTKAFTEQQKQDAMLRKMHQMKNENVILKKKHKAEKFLRQQQRQSQEHCRELRNMLNDLRLTNIRRYSWHAYPFPGTAYYHGKPYFWDGNNHYRYDFLERDLQWQIRNYCR